MFKRKSRRNRNWDNRDSNLVRIDLDAQPRGYPRTATYLDSDKGAALFRRFGESHARVLLYLQVEITGLERQLKELDLADDAKEDTSWKIANSIYYNDGEGNEKRKELLDKLKDKLKEYDDILLRDTQLRRLPRPSRRAHQNFFDFIWTENPFGPGEKDFIYHQHDFVVLDSDFEDSWLDEFIHMILGHCRRGLLRNIFVSPEDQAKTKDPHVHYYSEDRMGTLIKIIVAVVSIALLFIPIFIFLSCRNLSVKDMTAITLFFALSFATALSVFTSANRQETFAATAAYCAVITVFLGNQLSAPSSKLP